MAIDTQILEALEMQDCFFATKVTARRRELWLKGAKPGHRWGVTLTEGGKFSYGRSLRDAIGKALEGLGGDTESQRGTQGLD